MDLDSEGGLGVELQTVQWQELYFDTEPEAQQYLIDNPTTTFNKVWFNSPKGKFMIFFKEE